VKPLIGSPEHEAYRKNAEWWAQRRHTKKPPRVKNTFTMKEIMVVTGWDSWYIRKFKAEGELPPGRFTPLKALEALLLKHPVQLAHAAAYAKKKREENGA